MRLLFIAISLCAALVTQAQSYKKYVFLEHITNSRCGICGSKNPGFFKTIANYPKDIVHIAYHPSFPYSSCELYKANPLENNGRVSYYNDVAGTPTVVMNGKTLPSASTLITDAQINTAKALTSPIEIKVTESGTTTRSFKVTINKSSSAILPAGNYVFYGYMAEKLLPLATPNGEKEHHDVFRKALTAIGGTDVTASLTTTNSFEVKLPDYVVPAAYNEKEMYLIAFIQNATTKEILNVGTKYTTTTSTETIVEAQEWFTVYPNPATDALHLELKKDLGVDELVILDGQGRVAVRRSNPTREECSNIDISPLTAGIYSLKLKSGNQVAIQKIVKAN